MTKLTLITPTQGNPIALKRTIDSLKGIIDEVIVGSVCIFKCDEEKMLSDTGDIHMKLVKLPFNHIFTHGFSSTLNTLSEYAKNDWIIYLNVGEVVHIGADEILSKINDNYNCYYIDHPTEKHHWYRVYNRKEIQWSGLIHEELVGERRGYPEPLFTFADTEKDVTDPFYSKVMNDIKELCYFNQYLKLIDQPHLLGATNYGWVKFAHDGYHSFIERMHKKGDRYEAFITGDKEMYIKDIYENEEFKEERFNSSLAIEFQGSKMYLNVK